MKSRLILGRRHIFSSSYMSYLLGHFGFPEEKYVDAMLGMYTIYIWYSK